MTVPILLAFVSILIMTSKSMFCYKYQSKIYKFATKKYSATPVTSADDFMRAMNISSDKIKLIGELKNMLIEWNLNVNLISRKDIDSIYTNHILPSLSIYALRKFQKGEKIIDVGTGGGLPGLPMSIVNPDAQFTLIDSNSKKMKVVQNIVDTLKLTNVKVVCSRAEEYHEHYDFILGRAVSALPNFLNWSCHFLNHNNQNKNIIKNKETSTSIINNNLNDDLNLFTIPNGLLYLKGGDFTNELIDAKINPKSVQLYPVNELMPGLQNEKFLLYIPSEEITNFYNTKQRNELSLLQSKAHRKKI